MAGFEIGGNGSEYDKFHATGNSNGKKKTQGNKPKLTREQQQAIRDLLNKGKLRPDTPRTKYGINNPTLTPQLPDTTVHTKYGINTPTPAPQTKYGINIPTPPPQLPEQGTYTKYGINTPKK